MATYTDLNDWTGLQAGDVINYTTSGITIDATGFKFGCRLKGYSGHDNGTGVTIQTPNAWGANCYAEFDFTNVSDGNITIGNDYGSYLAITNGTATDIKYKRIMVAGDAGYLTNSGSPYYTYYYAAGNAGLFASSAPSINGYNYWVYGQYRTATCYGGYQSRGGTCTDNYAGTPVNGTFGGTTYGKGWYSGAYVRADNGGSPRTYYTVSAGGSSYLLTSNSSKPSGYFSEWQDYVGTISNSTSALLDTDRDYYAIITILDQPGPGPTPMTHNVYRYIAEPVYVTIPSDQSTITYTQLPCTEWEFNENVTPWNGHIKTFISEYSYNDILLAYCTDNTAYDNHEYDYVTYNNTNYPVHDNISTAPIFSGIISDAKQKADTYQNFVIVLCDDIVLPYQDLPGKRLKFGYFNGGLNMNVVNHGLSLALYVDNKNYDSLIDWLRNNATLVNAGETEQVDLHKWQPCSLKYYDGTDWVECDPMTYHNGDWE